MFLLQSEHQSGPPSTKSGRISLPQPGHFTAFSSNQLKKDVGYIPLSHTRNIQDKNNHLPGLSRIKNREDKVRHMTNQKLNDSCFYPYRELKMDGATSLAIRSLLLTLTPGVFITTVRLYPSLSIPGWGVYPFSGRSGPCGVYTAIVMLVDLNPGITILSPYRQLSYYRHPLVYFQ